MSTLTQSRAWLALKQHCDRFAATRMTDLFAADPGRFDDCSLHVHGVLLDYSKNLVTAETMQLLATLARERNLGAEIQRLFNGDKINVSEKRAVLHTALRDSVPVIVD